MRNIVLIVGLLFFWPGEAWAQPLTAQNLPHQGIVVVRRPGQIDGALIDSIAQIGALQRVTFAAGSNIRQFIAGKCGMASDTQLVHPNYLARFFDANSSAQRLNLSNIEIEKTFDIPACANFALQSLETEIPKGIDALARKLGMPFDLPLFRQLVASRDFRTTITDKYERLRLSEFPSQVCPETDLTAFFSCVNAIEIAYLNRTSINTADDIDGKIILPAAPAGPSEDRIPIRQSVATSLENSLSSETKQTFKEQGISNVVAVVPSITENAQVRAPIPGIEAVKLAARVINRSAPFNRALIDFRSNETALTSLNGKTTVSTSSRIEGDLSFVGGISNVEIYGEACSKAHEKMKGRWPFSVDEFSRVWALKSIADPPGNKRNILVVDSGLDFTYDTGKALGEPEKYVFPKEYMWRNLSDTTDQRYDKDDDGIYGNHGYAGVNLVSQKPASDSGIDDPNRSHGLSVANLALGGRVLDHLRAFTDLKIKLGIASLASFEKNPIYSKSQLYGAIKYVTAEKPNNGFSVINLSLSTKGKLADADKMVASLGQGKVLVVAAGNDATAIDDSDFNRAIWPALQGGKPRAQSANDAVFITVGAHDADGNRAGFSNFGSDFVDLLAPGCMVPSYEIKRTGNPPQYVQPPQIVPAEVSGTSFAAPTVSFLASLLMTDLSSMPAANVKERVLVGTNFSAGLYDDVYSSGILNVSKVLGFDFDILETGARKNPVIHFGTLNNKDSLPEIHCSGITGKFGVNIRKLAYDPDSTQPTQQVMVFVKNSVTNPSSFMRSPMCRRDDIQDFRFNFTDAETGLTADYNWSDTLEYIAKTN